MLLIMALLSVRLSLGMQFLLLKDLSFMARQEEVDLSTDSSLNFNEITPQVSSFVPVSERFVVNCLGIY